MAVRNIQASLPPPRPSSKAATAHSLYHCFFLPYDGNGANRELSMEEKQSLVTGVGEWWMSYDHFTKCFTHLTICHPEPEPEQRQAKVDWKETSFEVASQLAEHII